MPVEQDFRTRLNEVSFYLRSLSDVERRQVGRRGLFYRANAALAASRAASFIMIYNCVEYGTKQALNEIRVEASTSVARFEELVEYWQDELVRGRFGNKLSDGVNHSSFLVELRKSLPVQTSWLRNSKSLPFGGNINHERLIDLARKIGDSRWRPPRNSLGGVDLELIRKARNDLAHGEETFENVGSQYSITDITDKLTRIRTFMCSYIRMLERYRTGSRYRT